MCWDENDTMVGEELEGKYAQQSLPPRSILSIDSNKAGLMRCNLYGVQQKVTLVLILEINFSLSITAYQSQGISTFHTLLFSKPSLGPPLSMLVASDLYPSSKVRLFPC